MMTIEELNKIRAAGQDLVAVRNAVAEQGAKLEQKTAYRKQVLVCGGTGCTSSGSQKVIAALEKALKAAKLEKEILLVKTGCFGLCSLGPIMIVYPEGAFYSQVTPEGVEQLTTDHSLVQMMIQRGELTPELAKNYPGKNLITRAIGTETMVKCDIFHRRVKSGENFLLCTDGLSNIVDEQEMLFEVVHGSNQESACQRLLAIAENRGAPDNVTCILVQI